MVVEGRCPTRRPHQRRPSRSSGRAHWVWIIQLRPVPFSLSEVDLPKVPVWGNACLSNLSPSLIPGTDIPVSPLFLIPLNQTISLRLSLSLAFSLPIALMKTARLNKALHLTKALVPSLKHS